MTTQAPPQAQKMLQEIEEVIADKELKFGCEAEYMRGKSRQSSFHGAHVALPHG